MQANTGAPSISNDKKRSQHIQSAREVVRMRVIYSL